jgi:hypothetical protein
VYYARAVGNFQTVCDDKDEVTVNKWVYMVNFKKLVHDCDDFDKITNEEYKKTAKEAETRFKFKEYDKESNTSLVKYIF